MPPKKIRQQSITGLRGMTLVQDILLEIGFVTYPTGDVEAGIDAFIEIRDPDTGEVTNSIIQVQSKATQSKFEAETETSFVFRCDADDLNYWLMGNIPFILVVSRPTTREAYWISIKDYFKPLERRKARKIVFDKQRDRLDASCREALINLAMPADSGLYFAPPIREEVLYSNLLEVIYYPERIYVADTMYRKAEDLRAELRARNGQDESEWLLKNKRVYSFNDLDRFPWRVLCDVGTLESFDAKDWALSDNDERRRDFVQLMNYCLRAKARGLDLRWSKDQGCYFFRPTNDLSNRVLSYKSIVNQTSRDVFRAYYKIGKVNEVAFYRHSAFKGFFVRYENDWYLEITPTYYFTRDGRKPDSFYEEKLKKIKEIEDNPAVLGQVVMWAEYLSKHGEGDLFTSSYPLLKFGALKAFDIDQGINDKAWLPRERSRRDENEGREDLFREESWLF
jgi:hypothetical protein